jgi:hypothetical protein
MKGQGIFSDISDSLISGVKTGLKGIYHGVSKIIDPFSSK